jgi:alpha-galactosidase
VPAAVLAVAASFYPAKAATPPIAQGPVMGYNTWYQYRTNANEADVLRQARLLVSTGLANAGYDTMNLDDGWMASKRTRDGALTWNTGKFPHGIPWLAAQLHSMGLKFGLYAAIGTRTCQHYPGSWGHYAQDARTFARWNVDFVKVDECGGLPAGTTLGALTADFRSYGEDLRSAIPAVVYSEELPLYSEGKPGFISAVRSSAGFANMWRVTPDEYPLHPAYQITLSHLADDLHLYGFAGAGHWNDLDLLAPAMPSSRWSQGDLQSQLSVWAEEASPLLISADLSKLTADEIDDLENPDLIAIDQSGSQASEAVTSGTMEAISKSAANGTAVLLVNAGKRTATGTFSLSQLHVSTGYAAIYNVWTGGTRLAGRLAYTLPAGHTALLVLTGQRAGQGRRAALHRTLI